MCVTTNGWNGKALKLLRFYDVVMTNRAAWSKKVAN